MEAATANGPERPWLILNVGHNMRHLALMFLSAFVMAGCVQRSMQSTLLEMPTGIGGQEASFGDYSYAEVEMVRASLTKVSFPAPEGTVARLLPRTVRPLPVQFGDWMPDHEKKGRVGGNVVEYWLNDVQVLKVATAYYEQGKDRFSRDEWAVVLKREERDDHARPIYPGAMVLRIAK